MKQHANLPVYLLDLFTVYQRICTTKREDARTGEGWGPDLGRDVFDALNGYPLLALVTPALHHFTLLKLADVRALDGTERGRR